MIYGSHISIKDIIRESTRTHHSIYPFKTANIYPTLEPDLNFTLKPIRPK